MRLSCGSHIETVIHVLRDSVQARQLWDRVLLPSLSSRIFTWNLRDWFLNNLKQVIILNNEAFSWSSLFISIVWQLWKQRNDLVFSDLTQPTDALLRRCIVWAKYYANYMPKPCKPRLIQQTAVLWGKPPAGWMCLNTDGAVSLSTGRGSIGGAIRDSHGVWMVGFSKNIGISSILQAELLGIYIGLTIAQSSGFTKIIVQSDSTWAIKILDDINAIRSHIPLVQAIAGLRMCAWELRFQWVPRCSNYVADRLAKFAPACHFYLVQYASPPLGIMDLLAIDSIATSTGAATPALD
ncbi:hypothetical protein F3Y22_tig00014862pilonHSYRG00016 [Hibiscus syriacus]|uniref:RNase H type-1 domain-containing protein n=1 Tax=Hibiscus syriacus TaxID=106335 RepID=A0A6A3BZ40_HIBSY|nr:hypothetical protein F3Y22_tig00014862pilonHSYRG00016 [Hibiscus syriacus]